MKTNDLTGNIQNGGIRLIKIFLAFCSIVFIGMYLVVGFHRLFYPFELEWMEGEMLDHVRRIIAGQSLYVRPSVEFVPSIYPPLYFYLGAIAAHAFGMGFFPLRLISYVSSCGCFVLIFLLVRKETKSALCALFSAGLFAAAYRIGGAWLDVARVDSLFLFFVLFSAYILRYYNTAVPLFCAGFLLFLAFLTKQTGMIFIFTMALYCFLYLPGWKKIVLPLTALACIVISTLLFNAASGGWYSYYVFQLPGRYSVSMRHFASFWMNDFSWIGPAYVLTLLFCYTLFRKLTISRNGFYILFLFGMMMVSCSARIHVGGYENDLIPAFAAISVLFGLALQEFFNSGNAQSAFFGNMKISYFAGLAGCMQFLLLIYNPLDQIPSQRDRDAGEYILGLVKEYKGDVFIPSHGYLSAMTGKKNFAHWMAIEDIYHSRDDSAIKSLQEEFRYAFSTKKFDAIIIDNDASDLEREMLKTYSCASRIFNAHDVFFPVTGFKTRPELIYKALP